MICGLRRCLSRTMHFKSLVFWLGAAVITMLIISTSIVTLYDNHQQVLVSDSLHPISVRWRQESLSLIIRPELDTAIIQPILDIHQVCSGKESNPDVKPLQILIMVMSVPQNWKAREAIRQTWANKTWLPHEARVFFMLGITPDEKVTRAVQEESVEHNDIIAEDFLDTYDNLTLKSLFILKWASKRCSTATHLLKTDDDMMILADNLIERLRYITDIVDKANWRQTSLEKEYANANMESQEESNKLTKAEELKEESYGNEIYPYNKATPHQTKNHSEGNLRDNIIFGIDNTHPTDVKMKEYRRHIKQMRNTPGAYILGHIYQGVLPVRDEESKWFLPRSIYPEDHLPDFASGTAYIIAVGSGSVGAIKTILMKSLQIKPAIPLEDVFITGIVAGRALALPLLHDNKRFHKAIPILFPWSVSQMASCFYDDSVAIHGLAPKDIITGWKHLRQLSVEDCNSITGFLQKNIYRFLSIFQKHIDKS